MSDIIHIREATQKDAPAIAGIHVTAWRAAYAGMMPAGFLAELSVEKRTTFWEKELAGQRSVNRVAVEKNNIVGWASGGPSRDEDPGDSSEVYAIYVSPGAWGRGIGRKLMQGLEGAIPQGPDLTLWVLEQNQPAIRFYLGLGYQPDTASKTVRIAGTELTEIRLRKKGWTPEMISATLRTP